MIKRELKINYAELGPSQQTGKTGVQQIEIKIDKELEKLKYYLENTDELIEDDDLREMEAVD